MRTPLILLTLLATVAAVPADPPAPRPCAGAEVQKFRERVQAKLDDLREKAEFPGVSVGFVLADGRSAGVASGFADLENKTPLTPGDRLLAGSIGKTFVAAVQPCATFPGSTNDSDCPITPGINFHSIATTGLPRSS
jgi:CubicO group peptidase (beta-lactamase class C family)